MQIGQVIKTKLNQIQIFSVFVFKGTRPAPANIQPEDFDPCICTHVLYSFVNLRNSRLELTSTDQSMLKIIQKIILLTFFSPPLCYRLDATNGKMETKKSIH